MLVIMCIVCIATRAAIEVQYSSSAEIFRPTDGAPRVNKYSVWLD